MGRSNFSHLLWVAPVLLVGGLMWAVTSCTPPQNATSQNTGAPP